VLPVEPLVDGVVVELELPGVLELLLEEPGVVVLLTLPLTEPVPVAPIDEVPGAVPLPEAVVVSVLLLVLPVVVLGDVVLELPLSVPLPLVLPGVVLDDDELVAPVPLVPAALSLRWQAPSERAATTATAAAAVWVRVVFISTP
jgi:hypothetical protein